ncbi:unnamed protein product [Lampetra planeri]
MSRFNLIAVRKRGGGMSQHHTGWNYNGIWVPIKHLQERGLFGAKDHLCTDEHQTPGRCVRRGQKDPSHRIDTARAFVFLAGYRL